MLDMSKQLNKSGIDEKTSEALGKYLRAADAPTPLSKDVSNQREYRLKLENALDDELESEAKIFAKSMKDTGLVSPYFAVLLRFLKRKNSFFFQRSLDLSETGIACYNANKKLIHDIIQISIYPETRQAIYGLAKMLDRGVLNRGNIIPAIRRLFDLPIHAQVRQALAKPEMNNAGISLNGLLVAGVVMF